ncbi:hypothetical protein HII31_01810 [Pseudocercospora fuligena]|uniref:Spt20-like SEP domain-containing protein n=1 Tax=Pseudocercospora fuligena TaxID=685502 RepID=A0A8H6RT75_9PEZI|nr:hypothetical protein HII31_01810 [Pseudocercospora fuligena]
MATAAVVRPGQPRTSQRRDGLKPSIASLKRANMNGTAVEDGSEPASKRQRTDRGPAPAVRTRDWILKQHAGKPPSMVLHLHPTYFRFDTQEGSYAYDGPMKFIIDALKKQRVPHEMLEEIHANNVPFYHGCLIIEVHNHRTASAKDKGRNDSAADGGPGRYSMHVYNNYITPSGFAPYPKKAKEEQPDADADEDTKKGVEKSANKERNGPQIASVVLFPTELSMHYDMMILARTPASDLTRSKKKGADGAQPPTPSLAVPPTPIGGAVKGDGKMCLEEKDFYQWQADVLVETERSLMLGPVDAPETAHKVLDALAHPLHQDMPPSSKTRKRTTAEMAADDEKAAEAERRMLIMDERIKPSSGPGAAASENAGTAAALGFGRFKTIQMVREKHEEQERQKKEEEAQIALQRRQQEEQAAAQAAQARAQEAKQRQIMAQRQNMARQQQEQQRIQAAQLQAQQAALMAQNHAHPQQNNMMMNQQNNFQHPASMAQSSPVVRQQTPSMMNSSPMLAQGGFPMAATTSQGAGSPQRPASATIQNPNVANAMARQVSQQQHPSRNATPQMPQATPHMQNAGPNRQVSQTLRMPQASPAPGTPAATMAMATPQVGNGMTPEQLAMLQAQQRMQAAQNGMSPGQHNPNQMSAMTPEQIQNIRQNQLRQAAQQQQFMQQAQGNPQMAAALAQRQAMMVRQQQQQVATQQRLMQAQQQQAAHAGSPHPGMQGTPQMNHGHPQGGDSSHQMTPQQQAARQQMQQQQLRQAQQQLAHLASQYGGLNNVPQQILSNLPPAVQMLMRQQAQRQQAARAQQMAARAQQAQHQGQAVAGTSSSDPEYMQTLRQHQALLAQSAAQQQQQQNMNMGGMSMAGNMQFGNQNQGDALSAQFQVMQRALNNQNNQQGGLQ